MAKKKAKKKVGRHTKYKLRYCKALIKFFDSEPYEDREIPHYEKSGKKDKDNKPIVVWVDYKRMPNKLPTLRDFAKSIEVSTVAVYDWMKKHKAFLNAFTHAQELRKWFLIQNGLQGLYNPLFAKFTAINITDMVDKSDVEHSGSISFTEALSKAIKKDENN